MKKSIKSVILLVLLPFILLPFVVSAVDTYSYCNVISGTGNDIGDEIECAGEHFYLIDKTTDKTRMLSKYNLLSGSVYGLIDMTPERAQELNELYPTLELRKTEIFNEPEFKEYKEYIDKGASVYWSMMEEDLGKYLVMLKLPVFDVDHNNLVHQDPTAIGAHSGTLGQPVFPEVGVYAETAPKTPNTPYGGNYYYDDNNYPNDFPLDLYDEYLQSMNIYVDGMTFLSVKDINNLLDRISGRTINLKEAFENQQEIIIPNPFYGSKVYLLANLKDYLPEGYEWLYSTTYWTKTGITDYGAEKYDELNGGGYEGQAFFVDTLGYICSKYGCSVAVGAGARPLVTIDNSFIKYGIYTKVLGSGSIEVVPTAAPGEKISFILKANSDIELKQLTIVTPSGEKISFNEDEITYNQDGTITVRSNTFIMPKESVTIEATLSDYVKGVEENPKTGIREIYTGIYILITVSIITYLLIRKKDYFKEM